MKFDTIYPTARTEDEIVYKGSTLFKSDEESPCWQCGEMTLWIDLSFEAPLCSEECEDLKWEEFRLAFNKGDVRWEKWKQ